LPRRSAESLRGQIGALAKVRDRRRPVSDCERERVIPTIAAIIRSRCERIQRANAYTAIAVTAAHASVVTSPRNTDPPNASSRFVSVVPANRESNTSIAGTIIDASSIVAPTKKGALRQLGARVDASVRLAATSQQSRKPCKATTPANRAAMVTTSPRESWLETSS
jgi:hypothetical protein